MTEVSPEMPNGGKPGDEDSEEDLTSLKRARTSTALTRPRQAESDSEDDKPAAKPPQILKVPTKKKNVTGCSVPTTNGVTATTNSNNKLPGGSVQLPAGAITSPPEMTPTNKKTGTPVSKKRTVVTPKSGGKSSTRKKSQTTPIKGEQNSNSSSNGSSSSDSSSSSSDSSDSDVPVKKPPKKKGTPRSIVRKKKSTATSGGESGEESGDSDDRPVKRSNRARTETDELIGRILSRWWYGFPPWPPKHFDFQAKLTEKNLRQVSLEEWEDAPELENEKLKVYEISHYPGTYFDPRGEFIDLRPKEVAISYANLKTKSASDLKGMIATCLVGQIQALDGIATLREDQKSLKSDLVKELRTVERFLNRQK